MAFDGLADKLSAAFKRLKSKGKLSESDVKEAMREVRLALLEADVNYKVAKDFTNKVTERDRTGHWRRGIREPDACAAGDQNCQ